MPKRSLELDAAINWLSTMLERGPVPAAIARKSGPGSWRTLQRAKVAIGLATKKVKTNWYWYRPDKPFSPLVPSVKPTEPELEEDAYRADTAEIILGVNGRVLQGQDEDEIIRGIIQDCAAYPMPKPYPREYIESVVRHAMHGTPIRANLNPNES